MAHDVFISYCTEDKPIADAVCATLEAQGMRCWIAPRDILPGTDWGEAIIDAIQESKAMLLVFSSKANASQQIKREVERAVNRGIDAIHADQEGARAAMIKWAGLTPEMVGKIGYPLFEKGISEQDVQVTIDLSAKYKLIPRSLKARDVTSEIAPKA